MPAGDAQRTWFPEMVDTLRREWHRSMPIAELVALCDRLDAMLHAIRSERGILPAMMNCPRCKSRHRAAPPRLSVRALILALARFGIAHVDEVRKLERSWNRYRHDQRLDLHGKVAVRIPSGWTRRSVPPHPVLMHGSRRSRAHVGRGAGPRSAPSGAWHSWPATAPAAGAQCRRPGRRKINNMDAKRCPVPFHGCAWAVGVTRPIAFAVLVLLCGSQAVVSHAQPPVSQPQELVWQWFDRCSPKQTMRVNVLLDGRSLYAGSFPACAMRRADMLNESERKILRFSFRGKGALFGDEFKVLGTQEIEGNIWRAGGERDAFLLGVSFATTHRVLLNSIHVAEARKASRTTLAGGLLIRTSSVRSAGERPIPPQK